jgi:hypothetical protein
LSPNKRELAALRELCLGTDEYEAKLQPAGPKTIAGMLEKGWIERRPDSLDMKVYKITPRGSEVFDLATTPRGRIAEPTKKSRLTSRRRD